jgi:hypothetical protein
MPAPLAALPDRAFPAVGSCEFSRNTSVLKLTGRVLFWAEKAREAAPAVMKRASTASRTRLEAAGVYGRKPLKMAENRWWCVRCMNLLWGFYKNFAK